MPNGTSNVLCGIDNGDNFCYNGIRNDAASPYPHGDVKVSTGIVKYRQRVEEHAPLKKYDVFKIKRQQ